MLEQRPLRLRLLLPLLPLTIAGDIVVMELTAGDIVVMLVVALFIIF